MIVTVRCLSSLAGLEPPDQRLDLPGSARLRDVYARLGLAADADVVALLDGGPARPDTALHDGAVLELVPMVDGG
jgi:sulfur carrier protein ThiS